jgi:2'-5' RNA ligase
MRYIMPCLMPPPILAYHRELVDLVAERFGLTFTRRQAIPAHFTLKYHFTTPEIGHVEALLDDFIRKHRRTSITVGGFGHFVEDVVFVDVQLSDAARRVLEALVSALRTVPWMSWDRFDAENLHPHMTIVERCRPPVRRGLGVPQDARAPLHGVVRQHHASQEGGREGRHGPVDDPQGV